jgi:CubicO group peptidase (beta-lactamase class C family)
LILIRRKFDVRCRIFRLTKYSKKEEKQLDTQQWVSKFESYSRRILDKYEVPGTSIGLAKDGRVIYQKGIGHRDVDKNLEVTEDTIFGIASITKSFTGVAIMQLQEAGKLSVHDPVVNYLPEFQVPNKEYTKKITIHHFLTHTAGLPPLPTLYHAMARTMDNDSSITEQQKERIENHDPIDKYDQLMRFIGELDFDLLGEPGTEFSYSNDSYALLGAIIERVSGVPYDVYVTENILKKAGMTSSTFNLDLVLESDQATTIYATRESETEGEEEVYAAPVWWDSPAMFAAGFLRSTLRDMLRYTEIYRNQGVVGETRILSAESVKEMMYPHFQYQQNKYYGYGLMITPNYHGGTLVEHGGSLKGISSHMSIVPERGLTGIILTNLVGVPVSPILLGAINSVQGLEPETPLQTYHDFDIPRDQLDQYVGQYKSGEGAEMSVSLENQQLMFTNQGKTYPMRPVGKHLFTVNMNEAEAPIRFLFNQNDELYGLFLGVRQILKEKTEKTVSK